MFSIAYNKNDINIQKFIEINPLNKNDCNYLQ